MPYTGIVKYHVKLSYDVDGLVEKADIIGAIFGQTEGLLGPEMNLNELQRVSKIGRIEVTSTSNENTTNGNALLPMSTDIDTCSLIAAAIESIDKVGPFDSHFKLESIDDVRASKKEDILKRAKERDVTFRPQISQCTLGPYKVVFDDSAKTVTNRRTEYSLLNGLLYVSL